MGVCVCVCVVCVLCFRVPTWGNMVIARGFMFGQDAYLKQPYNGLDFAVLLIATSQFLLHFNRHADDDSTPAHIMTGVEMLRGLRILAIFEPCMRPLKPICRSVR
jgi:hypothetical protein